MINIGAPEVEAIISPQEPTVVNLVDDTGILCRLNIIDQAAGRLLIDQIADAIRSRRWME